MDSTFRIRTKEEFSALHAVERIEVVETLKHAVLEMKINTQFSATGQVIIEPDGEEWHSLYSVSTMTEDEYVNYRQNGGMDEFIPIWNAIEELGIASVFNNTDALAQSNIWSALEMTRTMHPESRRILIENTRELLEASTAGDFMRVAVSSTWNDHPIGAFRCPKDEIENEVEWYAYQPVTDVAKMFGIPLDIIGSAKPGEPTTKTDHDQDYTSTPCGGIYAPHGTAGAIYLMLHGAYENRVGKFTRWRRAPTAWSSEGLYSHCQKLEDGDRRTIINHPLFSGEGHSEGLHLEFDIDDKTGRSVDITDFSQNQPEIPGLLRLIGRV